MVGLSEAKLPSSREEKSLIPHKPRDFGPVAFFVNKRQALEERRD